MDETSDRLDAHDEEVAAHAGADPEAFLSILPHFYRGSVSQATNSQDRLD